MTGTPPRPTSYWDYIRVEQLLGLQSGIAAHENEIGDDEVQNVLGVSYIEHLNFRDGKVARMWAFGELPDALKEAAVELGNAP